MVNIYLYLKVGFFQVLDRGLRFRKWKISSDHNEKYQKYFSQHTINWPHMLMSNLLLNDRLDYDTR